MKIIDYRCQLFAEPVNYQLVQHESKESYQLFCGHTLMGSFIKVGDRCVQITGMEVPESMLEDICKLI